jgi:hypothetical protein
LEGSFPSADRATRNLTSVLLFAALLEVAIISFLEAWFHVAPAFGGSPLLKM